MTRARSVFWLQGALSCAGLIVVVSVLAVAATRIDFALPSAAAIAGACRRWAFPDGATAPALVAALGSLALAALALTTRSGVRQVSASRQALHRLRHVTPMRGHAGVMAFDDHVARAFCAGFARPRIYLSTGALGLLSDTERAAVIAHEAHHARRRDPLRLLVMRALADGLFFLPALRRLADRYRALAELAADEAAVRATRDSHALASALLAFDALADPAMVGIAPERVDHLLGEQPRWELPIALVAGAAVTVVAVAAVTLRLADATGHSSIALPELLAQACMLAMALAPVAAGAAAIVAGRRILRLR
jgi:Zn-dependent protease with chaperone function